MSECPHGESDLDDRPFVRAVEFIRRKIRSGGTFRDCDSSRHVLAVWLNWHVQRIDEWHRTAFVRDFRSMERVIDHGCDLERRIRFIELLFPLLDEPARCFTNRLRDDSIQELAAVSDIAQKLIDRQEFMVVGPAGIESDSEADRTKRISAAIGAVVIAARGFCADRDGWEALHLCVERWRASVILTRIGLDMHDVDVLSSVLFRCRGVSRLLDVVQSARDSHPAAATLAIRLARIKEIRLTETLRTLTVLRTEGILPP